MNTHPVSSLNQIYYTKPGLKRDYYRGSNTESVTTIGLLKYGKFGYESSFTLFSLDMEGPEGWCNRR